MFALWAGGTVLLHGDDYVTAILAYGVCLCMAWLPGRS